MPNRLPVVLTVLAALALALAPLRALFHGTAELGGFLRVAAALLVAWALARAPVWGRWLVTLLAVATLWAAWRSWRLLPAFRNIVPDYHLWRAGRALGAVLLAGAAVTVWAAVRGTPTRAA